MADLSGEGLEYCQHDPTCSVLSKLPHFISIVPFSLAYLQKIQNHQGYHSSFIKLSSGCSKQLLYIVHRIMMAKSHCSVYSSKDYGVSYNNDSYLVTCTCDKVKAN